MHIRCATIIASRGLEPTAECWTVWTGRRKVSCGCSVDNGGQARPLPTSVGRTLQVRWSHYIGVLDRQLTVKVAPSSDHLPYVYLEVLYRKVILDRKCLHNITWSSHQSHVCFSSDKNFELRSLAHYWIQS